MPSWTTDEGENLFGKAQCGRCLQWIKTDSQGDIPRHNCLSDNPLPCKNPDKFSKKVEDLPDIETFLKGHK